MSEEEPVLGEFATRIEQTSARLDGRAANNTDPSKDIVVAASFADFVQTTKDGAREQNKIIDTIPTPFKRETKKDGVAKQYNAPLKIDVTLTMVRNTIPNICEKKEDEPYAWQIHAEVIVLSDAQTYIKNNYAKAWKALEPDQVDTDEYRRIRTWVNEHGQTNATTMYVIRRGEKMRVTSSFGPKNVLCWERPNCPGVPLVQRHASLELRKLSLKIYLGTRLVKVDDEHNEAAGEDGAEKPQQREVTRLSVNPVFKCSNVALDVDYNTEMSASELLHTRPALYDSHYMVPMDDYIAGKRVPPSSANFLISQLRQSRWAHGSFTADGSGVTVGMSPIASRDWFVKEFQGNVSGRWAPDCQIWQWKGKPSMVAPAEHYKLNFITTQRNNDAWRSFGITEPNTYADIMCANMRLPVHVRATLWANKTKDSSCNNPVIRDTDDLHIFYGTYFYLVDELTPDFQRFLPENSIIISPERVKQEFKLWTKLEFSDWNAVQSGQGKTTIILDPHPAPPKLFNRSIYDVVIALGNGRVDGKPPANTTPPGRYHAFSGDIMPLFEDGKYTFHVLVGGKPTESEWLNRKTQGDAILDRMIADADPQTPLSYWIYALRIDAPRADPPILFTPAPVIVGEKRPREEDE